MTSFRQGVTMFEKTANLIAKNIMEHSSANAEDFEVHVFGAQQGLVILLNIITFVVIGLLVGVFWQIVIFACAYISLRVYTGGYHASTPVRCYIMSTVMILFFALLMRFVVVEPYAVVSLLALCGLAICFAAPIDNENKRIDSDEKRVYKRRAVIIGAAQITIALVCLWLGFNIVVSGIFWAVSSVTILMGVAAVTEID